MTQNSIELDATDLRLLQLLQVDASRSNQALAALLQLSPPTCLRRVRRLQETGLIERQGAILQPERLAAALGHGLDRKSTRLNSSHSQKSYAVFCFKKKKRINER